MVMQIIVLMSAEEGTWKHLKFMPEPTTECTHRFFCESDLSASHWLFHSCMYKNQNSIASSLSDTPRPVLPRASHHGPSQPAFRLSRLWHFCRLLRQTWKQRRKPRVLGTTRTNLDSRNGYANLVADFLDIWKGWPTDEKCAARRAAAREWKDGVVSMLLAKAPFDAGANLDGVFCLPSLPAPHVAAQYEHRIGARKGLLEKGAHPNLQGKGRHCFAP